LDVIAMMEPVSEEEAADLTEQIQTMLSVEAPVDDVVENITAENVSDAAISVQSREVVTETVRTEPEEWSADSVQEVVPDSEAIPEIVSAAEAAAEDEASGEDLSGEVFAQKAEEGETSDGKDIRSDARQADSQNNMSPKADTPVVTTNTVTTVNADGTQTIFQTETLRYSDVDVESLMRQITTEASVQITDEHSVMTMQLEPENLGRLTLQVMSKGSAVTAQIIAENEAVKHAIEANVSTLQENLTQSGLKVEAVEVTVESHAFEQNLEQGAGTGAQAQQQEQQSQQSSVRHGLYLNELDELSGLMSEEELLAAQIMADNGNTMDVSA
jgi:flagellar hook-length control protein FliK